VVDVARPKGGEQAALTTDHWDSTTRRLDGDRRAPAPVQRRAGPAGGSDVRGAGGNANAARRTPASLEDQLSMR
jgi:hypothetical protein